MPKSRIRRGERVVRTSLDLPMALWRQAKTRAVAEGRDLRDVLLSGLRLYLTTREDDDDEDDGNC